MHILYYSKGEHHIESIRQQIRSLNESLNKMEKDSSGYIESIILEAVPIKRGKILNRKFDINQEIQQINVNELSRIIISTLYRKELWDKEEFDKDPVPEQTVVDKYTVILDYGNYDFDPAYGFEPLGTSNNAYGSYNLKVTVTGYRKAGLFE